MRRSAHVVGIHSVVVFLYRWFGVQGMTREVMWLIWVMTRYCVSSKGPIL